MVQTARNMIITGELNYVNEAVDFLKDQQIKINGIIGKAGLARSFAEKWADRWKIFMNQRIYRIDFALYILIYLILLLTAYI